MTWTPPVSDRKRTQTQITDEIKVQMHSLLESGMNYRKVAATVGCSLSSVRKYFPGYGDNGTEAVEANRQKFKERNRHQITRDRSFKKHKKEGGA
jgi:transposase